MLKCCYRHGWKCVKKPTAITSQFTAPCLEKERRSACSHHSRAGSYKHLWLRKPDVNGLRWVCCPVWKVFNITCVSYLPSLHLFGGHDDDSRVLLKHHPPEVTDGVLQTALSGDVALLQLGAVNLVVQLRLHGHKQTNRQRVSWTFTNKQYKTNTETLNKT